MTIADLVSLRERDPQAAAWIEKILAQLVEAGKLYALAQLELRKAQSAQR